MLTERIAALAGDRTSGASEILTRAIDILRDALAASENMTEVARAVVRAQPAMAPVWNAALAALAEEQTPGAFEVFAGRVAAAPAGLTRTALDVFQGHPPSHIVTISYSGSVLAVVQALHGVTPLRVTCSESAPAMEGRRMAERLAAAGIAVTCTTDTTLDTAAAAADAVLVGADAISADWFLNKVGTRALVAAAAASGRPAYVVASADKFASPPVAVRLRIAETLFEPTLLADVRGTVSDEGFLDAAAVRERCEEREPAVQRLTVSLDMQG